MQHHLKSPNLAQSGFVKALGDRAISVDATPAWNKLPTKLLHCTEIVAFLFSCDDAKCEQTYRSVVTTRPNRRCRGADPWSASRRRKIWK